MGDSEGSTSSATGSNVESGGAQSPGRPGVLRSEGSFLGSKGIEVDDETGQAMPSARRVVLPPSLQPRPLLRVYETALIPVQNAADKTDLVLGSVQDVSDQVGRSCFMLRWRMPSQVEREAMREQVR